MIHFWSFLFGVLLGGGVMVLTYDEWRDAHLPEPERRKEHPSPGWRRNPDEAV